MTTPNQMATALLTEHFRYTPLTLLDDIINVVNELVYRAVDAIEEGLNLTPAHALGFRLDARRTEAVRGGEQREEDALGEAKQDEIDAGIVQLESLLNATVDKDFDKFEIYTLRNILAVGREGDDLAQWVQLDHYKNLQFAGLEEAATPEQVQLRRRKLQETSKLNAMLKAEDARNAAVLSQLQSLVGARDDGAGGSSPFAFLAASPHLSTNSAGRPLTQNVQYAVSQLPALRQLLAQLKESLRTLPNTRHAREDEDPAAAKRRQYVASQSRRALERRGIEPANPAVVAAASGRKIGRDEVEGMEAVVQALGGAETTGRHAEEMGD